jgi:hypothetical protein
MPRWALASLAAVLLLLAALGSQSYYGRVNIHNNERRGCLRSTLDRHVNARGWRIAQHARWNSYLLGGPGAANDLAASIKYDLIATSLESRTSPTADGRRAFCEKAFPAPSIVPWKA